MTSNRILSGKFSIAAFTMALMLFGKYSAYAERCVDEQAGKTHACSADEIRVMFADNARNVFGAPLHQCTRGQIFSFIADFHVRAAAKANYDVGLYFAIDGDPNGDGAASGVCSAHMIKDRHMDAAFPNAVMLGALAAANLDGDACRDISSTYGWRNIAGKIVTLRIDNALCHDNDGDGKLNLPSCTIWSNSPGGTCSAPPDTVATSASSCSCDNAFNIPIVVAPGTMRVTESEQQISQTPRKHDPLLVSESTTPRHAAP